MRFNQLLKIKKLYFTPEDVKKVLNISCKSACVTCSRYVKSGLLIRLKRNYYTLPGKLDKLSEEDSYRIANVLQVPSYISLTTALAFYNITTQVQRGFYESVALKRTRTFSIEDKTFIFVKISRSLYKGFIRRNGYFVATPEKAILDALYLTSLNRYSLDADAIDFGRFDPKRVKDRLKLYPDRVSRLWRKNVGSV